MPRTQSTLTRQLAASIVCAVSLQATATTEEVSKRIAAYRQKNVARMAWIIAGEYETLPAWIDAFCHECDTNECAPATPETLAAKIYDQGWTIEGGIKGCLLLCPSCTCGEEVQHA